MIRNCTSTEIAYIMHTYKDIESMDIDSIEQLVDIIRNARISELTVASDGAKVRLKKELIPTPVTAPKPAPRVEAPKQPALEVKEDVDTADYITAKMVGIFHGNSQDLIGAKVKNGQVVGSVESMRLMNDILSDLDGTIIEVLIEDGSPVEFGQKIFKVEAV